MSEDPRLWPRLALLEALPALEEGRPALDVGRGGACCWGSLRPALETGRSPAVLTRPCAVVDRRQGVRRGTMHEEEGPPSIATPGRGGGGFEPVSLE